MTGVERARGERREARQSPNRNLQVRSKKGRRTSRVAGKSVRADMVGDGGTIAETFPIPSLIAAETSNLVKIYWIKKLLLLYNYQFPNIFPIENFLRRIPSGTLRRCRAVTALFQKGRVPS